MTSAGAIALAEFLPESTSLLHLDLTENKLELAGVMALSQGLKSNHTMRCLDLNIPPSDEKMAQYVLTPLYASRVDNMTCSQNVQSDPRDLRPEHRRSREERAIGHFDAYDRSRARQRSVDDDRG